MTVTLQKSNTRDLGFVFSLAQNGVRHGHFDSSITREKTGFRSYLNAIISNERDLQGKPAQLLVAMENNERVGTSLVAAAAGTPDGGVELVMIAVKSEHRGKGYGATMLDMLMNHYLPRCSMYVRCFPASEKLRQMLLRRDFSEVGELGGAIILRHEAIRFADQPVVYSH